MNEMENKAYCDKCQELVEFEVRARMCKCQIKGEPIEYEEIAAFCKTCHSMVWAHGIDDHNLRESRKAYCEKMNLITPEKINDLLKKYNIGAKPLAQLLGWGDVTIIRFMNGAIPSAEYSNRLLELFSEDRFYGLVEENRGRLKPAAYIKLRKPNDSPEPKHTNEQGVVLQFGNAGVMRSQSVGETLYDENSGCPEPTIIVSSVSARGIDAGTATVKVTSTLSGK